MRFYYIFYKTFVKTHTGDLMSLHSTILNQLRSMPLSLADLQLVVDVSLPTLRKAIQELTQSRWIRIVGQAETNGGRPAKLFGLDDSYYLNIGVHLQLPGMHLAVTDLTGQILDTTDVFEGVIPRPDQVVQRITDYIQDIRRQFDQRQIVGVGIALPGFTDPNSGDIINIGRVPGWTNFPICSHLSALVDLPVTIANDVDCMALAEFQYSRITLDKNMIYVGFDEGVKASMFMNGVLYKGTFGNAGLIVTDLLNLDSRFSHDDYRQIQSISGVSRLFAERTDALNPAALQPYTRITEAESARQRFRLILEGAADSLPICEELVICLNKVLVAAIANIVMIIQPDTLILGGALSVMPGTLLTRLETDIRQHLPTLFTNRLIVQQAKLSSCHSATTGAVIHFLQEYLASDEVKLLKDRKDIRGVFSSN